NTTENVRKWNLPYGKPCVAMRNISIGRLGTNNMKPLLRKIFLWDAPAQGAFFGLTPFSCCSCLAEDFEKAVLEFLGFHKRYAELAVRLAKVITEFTTLVSSGTIARTQRIPIGQRARAAVIAWMRYNTTDYDHDAQVRGQTPQVNTQVNTQVKILTVPLNGIPADTSRTATAVLPTPSSGTLRGSKSEI
ncbi:MAG: DUF2293 domain-containing protein, partial [Victivallales bacterium]|nr:DUF2293 domain-containing protein [Victivallales bacterium]